MIVLLKQKIVISKPFHLYYTVHTVTFITTIPFRRQPKTPPVTRQCKCPFKIPLLQHGVHCILTSTANQLCSGQSGLGSYAILRTKQQKQQQTQLVQQRMGGYNSHAGKVAGKYHYFQPKPGKMSGGNLRFMLLLTTEKMAPS